jgi:two-component system OmpR family response regulator
MEGSLGRVLVVDDEPHVIGMLREAVTHFGYVVETVTTAEDALRVLPSFRPDVVLLDVTLPGISGEVLLEYLRAIEPQVPVIMVTGNSDEALARRLLTQGATDYLLKPFELARLGRVLGSAMARRRPT